MSDLRDCRPTEREGLRCHKELDLASREIEYSRVATVLACVALLDQYEE